MYKSQKNISRVRINSNLYGDIESLNPRIDLYRKIIKHDEKSEVNGEVSMGLFHGRRSTHDPQG